MMIHEILDTRHFSTADQEVFAGLSGDHNPMHMDPVIARRTQAGAPVVHGIHTLLWALDSLAARHPKPMPIATLRIRFDKLIYVGDCAQTVLTQSEEGTLRLEVTVEGTVALRLHAVFGCQSQVPPAAMSDLPNYDARSTTTPLDLDFEDMENCKGRISYAVPNSEIALAFPSAVRVWGSARIASLACSSFLVGMVCPGLHSIFGGLTLSFCESPENNEAIVFKVVRTDARFRMIRIEIAGSGLFGTVESFARNPPTPQQASLILANLVTAGEFAGSTALVVGGSRGLGELTAKLLAAGGARVLVSYATGRADAEKLQAEITAHGGQCEILKYDVQAPAPPQLHNLAATPDTMYYFATPLIYRRKAGLYVTERLAEFISYYATGFYNLCDALRRQRPLGISAFYPSTTFIKERPADMVEYAMSKVAGEELCAEMLARQQPLAIVVERLPRLPTDQTATLTTIETADPADIMLPIIRRVQVNRFI